MNRGATEIEERRIPVGDLAAGMYVCRLDRPWNETSFPLQGFLIDSSEQVAELNRLCKHVFIDLERGIAPDSQKKLLLRVAGQDATRGAVTYTDSNTVEEELPLARSAHNNAVGLVTKLFDGIRAGRAPSAMAIHEAVSPIVKSVLRSRDAFFWLESLRKRDTYSYGHAITCCALSAAFGRHLGFPPEVLTEVSTGALLMDIGKAELPEEILSRRGPLAAKDWVTIHEHVDNSLAIVGKSGIESEIVRDMVRTHHERDDGSGYPSRLAGAQIPLFGRIAGIIDSFDAMTNERPYRKAVAQHVALQQLYANRSTLFQSELVEQFMTCLGVYPTGSLVELNTGEVAVVMAQNQARRLRPRIMVLTTPEKEFDPRMRMFDLMMQASISETGEPSFVVRALDRGAHGLDLTSLYL
ncbi:MAG TPA: HD-GYP domain-containing protein [Rhodanobacteraceae bacterium]|nr:HD-GYP domain-containing protein [Rhodanobacteraceae bacterium]